ncbi:hypothetical protein RHGRI_026923 [Rhododendron griersonianum]|uniref:Dihydrolipoamide acetyltransferase component of pyruvate dehydrogenase complex n=1 Tax=Rhododendron griersonianum TaxID=479676 RepID=A0AAV6IV29_9ERIC|nr:hypothetical protein RHGRI_026923 [Rhododendron griersonianum]
MAPLLQSRAPAMSFSTSVTSSGLQSRPFTAFPIRPRRRILTVQAKIREIFMPALSSTMTEGKIVSWIKSEGDVLSKGESVVVVESDKADMDVETFYDGILAAIVVAEGEVAPVGAPIGLLAETEADVPEAKAKAAAAASSSLSNPSAPPPAHKVDVNSVVGTGPFGRITAADVEAAAGIAPSKSTPAAVAAAAAAVAAAAAPVAAAAPKAAGATTYPEIPGSTVVAFTGMQAAVSKNMVESLSVPTFRVGYPVTTDALDALYEKVKPKGVTMTVLLAKAAAMALAQHPVVNSTCKDGKSFTYNSSINIAVAVAINGGLITPVLQDADKLDLYLLSQKWKELVEKARAKQLQPHEYNSGSQHFGLSLFPIWACLEWTDLMLFFLRARLGAIMAVGASKPTVVADADGFFSVKSKMLVNVTADHRVIYGADLAAFLKTFSKIVENPESLTM